VQEEVKAFFDVHEQEGTHVCGVHLELMAECDGMCFEGGKNLAFEHLSSCYHTYCDPHLNASQALELAFIVADCYTKDAYL
jgi:3-deoxy-7-phosphoheptulonate synthase